MQSDICHLPMHYFSWFLYWWICLCICVQQNQQISQSSMGNVGHKLCILQSSSSHDETLIMFNHFSQLYLCRYLQGASCHHLHLNNTCHFISANCICVFVCVQLYMYVHLQLYLAMISISWSHTDSSSQSTTSSSNAQLVVKWIFQLTCVSASISAMTDIQICFFSKHLFWLLSVLSKCKMHCLHWAG